MTKKADAILASPITRNYMISCDFAFPLHTQVLKSPERSSALLYTSENHRSFKVFHCSVPQTSFGGPCPERSSPLTGSAVKREDVAWACRWGETCLDLNARDDPCVSWVAVSCKMQSASQRDTVPADTWLMFKTWVLGVQCILQVTPCSLHF